MWIQEIRQRGLRPWLNENPKVGTMIGAGLIGLSLIYIAFYLVRSCNPSPPTYSPGDAKAWFATEDGQNRYADDAGLIPPFQKDGKTFYRAHVFKCPGGEPFVAYIEMFPPDIKQQMEQAKQKTGGDPLVLLHHFADASLVKKPGPGRWLAKNPQNAQEMTARNAAELPENKGCAAQAAVRVPPPAK